MNLRQKIAIKIIRRGGKDNDGNSFYGYAENASDYTSLVSTFTNNESNPTLYTVDLSRKFNSAYIKTDEESVNKNPTKATDLKLTNPTLIKIKDKKVIDYIEGYDQIKNYMS